MKILMLILISFILVSCGEDSRVRNETHRFSLNEELKDCKIYTLISQANSIGANRYLEVVRCPNSSTTTNYRNGKTDEAVTVVEEPLETEEQKKQRLKASALEKLSMDEIEALGI